MRLFLGVCVSVLLFTGTAWGHYHDWPRAEVFSAILYGEPIPPRLPNNPSIQERETYNKEQETYKKVLLENQCEKLDQLLEALKKIKPLYLPNRVLTFEKWVQQEENQ